MSSVQIPKGFFLKHSKQEYSDYKTRLVCEISQNALDAKATKIELNFTDEYFECIDNGVGMDSNILINGLLTFGGTFKLEYSCGGFGAAKFLCLFSQDTFHIHTRNIKVNGEGLNYTLEENQENRQGTVIRGYFAQEWNSTGEQMANIAKQFLSKCQLKADVYVNGTKFTDWKTVKRCTRQNEWSKLYTHKIDHENYYVTVRKNGLYMFRKYLGEGIKKEIILEITCSSKEALTSNRDGLTQDKDAEFSKLFAEIIVDKKSFDKEKARKWIVRGLNNYWTEMFNKMKSAGDNIALVLQMETAFKRRNLDELGILVARYEASDTSIGNLNAGDIAKDLVKEVHKTLETDFIVDISGTDYTEIQKRHNPKTMAESNRKIAKLWKSALSLVFQANKMDAKYRIGFILNPQIAAQYSLDNGVEEFLINPEAKFWEEAKSKRIYELLICACHEVSHRNHTRHNDEFIGNEEKLLINTLDFISGDVNVISKSAKNLTI